MVKFAIPNLQFNVDNKKEANQYGFLEVFRACLCEMETNISIIKALMDVIL